MTAEDFEKSLIQLGTFNTVEGFWALYSHLVRPKDLPNSCEYFVFKSGIKPMWEDPANEKGGKWVIRVKKVASPRCWENVVLALIGEQFGQSAGEEVCGLVVSTKSNEDCISVWNRTAANKDATIRIRDVLKEVLDVPVNAAFEYKAHHVSLDHLSLLHTRTGDDAPAHVPAPASEKPRSFARHHVEREEAPHSFQQQSRFASLASLAPEDDE